MVPIRALEIYIYIYMYICVSSCRNYFQVVPGCLSTPRLLILRIESAFRGPPKVTRMGLEYIE